jgi:predicted nucleic acid-binding protein
MPDKVADASVIVALAFGESRAAEARELIDSVTLYAPDLLPYELCNVAVVKTRRDPERSAAIAAGLSFALAMDIDLIAVPGDELLALAAQTDLTAYDAAYLWVARDLECELLTFDQRLARAASRFQA